MSFDYDAPRRAVPSQAHQEWPQELPAFTMAAEAIRYAVEDLQTPKALGAWRQVGDERFNSSEIQRLYEAGDYPLRPCAPPGQNEALE
jgi:hypothetical protein